MLRVKEALHYGLDVVFLAPPPPMFGLPIRLLRCLSHLPNAPVYTALYQFPLLLLATSLAAAHS